MNETLVITVEGELDKVLRLAVLRTLAARGTKPSGYARPEIEGYSRDEIDAAVDDLRRGRYLEAAHVDRALGDNPAYWAPSILTAAGRQLLEQLSGQG